VKWWKRGRPREKEKRKEEGREGKKNRTTKMIHVVYNNSIIKSYPQQVVSERDIDDTATLFH
jgi:hypothetical protein